MQTQHIHECSRGAAIADGAVGHAGMMESSFRWNVTIQIIYLTWVPWYVKLTTWLASSAQSSSEKKCTQLRLNDCLATWRELHRPVYAARNIRSSEHVCCICQRIVAEWLSSCIYQFNVLCFTPLQYHKCLEYKICCALRVMTPTM